MSKLCASLLPKEKSKEIHHEWLIIADNERENESERENRNGEKVYLGINLVILSAVRYSYAPFNNRCALCKLF